MSTARPITNSGCQQLRQLEEKDREAGRAFCLAGYSATSAGRVIRGMNRQLNAIWQIPPPLIPLASLDPGTRSKLENEMAHTRNMIEARCSMEQKLAGEPVDPNNASPQVVLKVTESMLPAIRSRFNEKVKEFEAASKALTDAGGVSTMRDMAMLRGFNHVVLDDLLSDFKMVAQQSATDTWSITNLDLEKQGMR